MATQPKVTIEQLRERLRKGASSNLGTSDGSVPGSDSTSVVRDSSTPKSGNPLHPDIPEQVARLTEEVKVIKRQIYGGQAGDIGMSKHIQEIEGRVIKLDKDIRLISTQFHQLIELLGVEDNASET